MAHAKKAHEEQAEHAPPPLIRVRFRSRAGDSRGGEGGAVGIEDTSGDEAKDGGAPLHAATSSVSGIGALPQKRTSVTADESSAPIVNFSGSFELDCRPDRSQSPDEQMAALGYGFYSVKRAMANRVWKTTTITVKHDPTAKPFPTWHEDMTVAGVYNSSDEILLDGKPRETEKHGYRVTVKNYVNQRNIVVTRIEFLTKPAKGFVTEIRREIIPSDPQNEGKMTYKCVNTLTRGAGSRPIVRKSFFYLI